MWHRHIVVGWSIAPNPKTKEMIYDIRFKRLASEPNMDIVLRRPFTDEVEDYKEYKRLRQITRDRQQEAARTERGAFMPAVTISQDGTEDHYEVERRFAGFESL